MKPIFSALLLFFVIPTGFAMSGEPFHVVSYNIRLLNRGDGLDNWPHRVDAVTEFIARWDLVGLQEVTPKQVADLRERLGDTFGFYGLGREDGKSEGEHAAVFYRKSRFKILEESTFWLSETPQKAGSMGWDAACPRTVSWLQLRDKQNDATFRFANTHFDHKGKVARAQSAAMIRDKIKAINEGEAAIVLGDFNCPPNSEPYGTLVSSELSDTRLTAKQTIDGPQSTWNGFKKIIDDRIIDHVFVAGPVTVTEFQIHNPKTAKDRFASDHLPVRITVRIND
jgi:endonuclease/exonuclease/phosphatase family metal-dependent hydrolase